MNIYRAMYERVDELEEVYMNIFWTMYEHEHELE